MTKELERMIVDNSKRINTLDTGLTSLKNEVGTIKVNMTKISTTLDYQEVQSKERFESLNTTQLKMIDIMREKENRDDDRAREAIEYRHRREAFESEVEAERQKWVRSLITPQTIIILLFILAAFLGLRMSDMHAITGSLGLNPAKVIESGKAP